MSDCCNVVQVIKPTLPIVEIAKPVVSVVEIVERGLQGPPGEPGPAGPAGSGGTFIGAIVETDQTIVANIVLSSGKNAVSVGTVEIAAGYSVTIPFGARWVVV